MHHGKLTDFLFSSIKLKQSKANSRLRGNDEGIDKNPNKNRPQKPDPLCFFSKDRQLYTTEREEGSATCMIQSRYYFIIPCTQK